MQVEKVYSRLNHGCDVCIVVFSSVGSNGLVCYNCGLPRGERSANDAMLNSQQMLDHLNKHYVRGHSMPADIPVKILDDVLRGLFK